ncbi:MAG: nucleotidyltransferase domain-containing protein [Propionibacteriaceae bacterium]|jgi:predicted nucleotidyltransferase
MLFSEPFGGVVPGVRGAVLAVLLRTDAPLTGRQVHALISDHYSLWTVQEALKALTQLGLVHTQTIGRAGVHTINEDHVSVPPLRALLDPIAALTEIVREAVGNDVKAVILFGSIARGEASIQSDVDLAVIAPVGWDGSTDVEDAVRARLGNDCDVLVFTPEDFTRLLDTGEPVAQEILADGVALIGSIPRVTSGAA